MELVFLIDTVVDTMVCQIRGRLIFISDGNPTEGKTVATHL